MSDWRQWREDEAYERIRYCKAHKIKPLLNKGDIQIYSMEERNSFAVHLSGKGLSKREWEKLQTLLDETKGIVDVDKYGNLSTNRKGSAFGFSHRIELARKGVRPKVDEYYFVLDGTDMGYKTGEEFIDFKNDLETGSEDDLEIDLEDYLKTVLENDSKTDLENDSKTDSQDNSKICETPDAWRSCNISFNVNRQSTSVSLGELYKILCELGHVCP